MTRNEDLLRCSTCQEAWHEHLVIFLTFIQGLVFFTILSILVICGILLHTSLILASHSYNALIKYTIQPEEVLKNGWVHHCGYTAQLIRAKVFVKVNQCRLLV